MDLKDDSDIKDPDSGDTQTKTLINNNNKNNYHLSTQLRDHAYAVRDIAYYNNDCIVTCEERGMIHVFERVASGDRMFREKQVEEFKEKMHPALTFVVECVHPENENDMDNVSVVVGNGTSKNILASSSAATASSHHQQQQQYIYPPGTFISGGADKKARPFTIHGTVFEPIEGATNSVSSISVRPNGNILTGAWDGIVREYAPLPSSEQNNSTSTSLSRRPRTQVQCIHQYKGHEHGVEVLALHEYIITGSANKSIIIFDGNTRQIMRKIPGAHDHAIRKLIPIPLGFASCGNDGRIKYWSCTGDLLHSIDAHFGEIRFIYSICFNPLTSDIISCGEDGNAKVWTLDGELVQTIAHPCPIRSVKCLPNGDFIAACVDRTARIWTRDASRKAPEQEISDFDEMCQMMMASGMKTFDSSDLPDEKALTTTGKKEGEIKVVNVKNKGPTAYQWSQEAQTWVEIGQAMGHKQKESVDGKEFDFVTDVYVNETQKVQLGFNVDDDPEEVAENFVRLYSLPADAKPQIISHMLPKINLDAMQQKKMAKLQEKNEESYEQLPGWKAGGFEIFAAANTKVMLERIQHSNTSLLESQNMQCILSTNEMSTITQLVNHLSNPATFHNAEFPLTFARIMDKLLQWPTEHILPVMDCYRVCMAHSAGCAAIGGNLNQLQILISHCRNGNKETYWMLLCKIIANWVAKRPKASSERSETPRVSEDVMRYIHDALVAISEVPLSPNENYGVAFASLYHNIVSWYGRLNIPNSEFFTLLANQLLTFLSLQRSAKVAYFVLLSLGSIGFADPSTRSYIRQSLTTPLKASIIESSASTTNAALKKVTNDVRRMFSF